MSAGSLFRLYIRVITPGVLAYAGVRLMAMNHGVADLLDASLCMIVAAVMLVSGFALKNQEHQGVETV